MIYTVNNIDDCNLSNGIVVIYKQNTTWQMGYFVAKVTDLFNVDVDKIDKTRCFAVVKNQANSNNPYYWKFVKKIKVDYHA